MKKNAVRGYKTKKIHKKSAFTVFFSISLQPNHPLLRLTDKENNKKGKKI